MHAYVLVVLFCIRQSMNFRLLLIVLFFMFTPGIVHLLLMYKPGTMRSKTTHSHTPRNVALTVLLGAVVQSVPTTLRLDIITGTYLISISCG